MKDNIDNSGNGFFGTSVTSWCSPPNGPPTNSKSHGAFSDGKTRWTYPPTAPPSIIECKSIKKQKAKAVQANPDFSEDFQGIPEPWTTGPPNNNVIPFEEVENKKWRDEIKEIESHFQETDNFSQDRSQLLLLLSGIVLNPKIDIKVRKQACHTIVRHSNIRLLIESVLCSCEDCESLSNAQKGFELVDKAFAAQ